MSLSLVIARFRELGLKRAVEELSRTGYLRLGGVLVGKDRYGNEYYQTEGGGQAGRERYVYYAREDHDGSQVPAEWHQWLHNVRDETPDNAEVAAVAPKRYGMDHKPNSTGTAARYTPDNYYFNEKYGAKVRAARSHPESAPTATDTVSHVEAWTPGQRKARTD
jgi:NADH dehydrogenase (ubiquinone) 1 alpha subcomplex subunit 12